MWQWESKNYKRFNEVPSDGKVVSRRRVVWRTTATPPRPIEKRRSPRASAEATAHPPFKPPWAAPVTSAPPASSAGLNDAARFSMARPAGFPHLCLLIVYLYTKTALGETQVIHYFLRTMTSYLFLFVFFEFHL